MSSQLQSRLLLHSIVRPNCSVSASHPVRNIRGNIINWSLYSRCVDANCSAWRNVTRPFEMALPVIQDVAVRTYDCDRKANKRWTSQVNESFENEQWRLGEMRRSGHLRSCKKALLVIYRVEWRYAAEKIAPFYNDKGLTIPAFCIGCIRLYTRDCFHWMRYSNPWKCLWIISTWMGWVSRTDISSFAESGLHKCWFKYWSE